MAEITVGSVVRLKSGGPRMTVSKVEEFNGAMRARCEWFEGQKNQASFFALTSLELDEDEESSSEVYRPRGTPGKDSWME